MRELRVRRATVADAAVVAALNSHVHDLHVAAEPYDFRLTELDEVEAFFAFVLGAPTHVVLLAIEAEDPVGYAWAEDQARPANPFKNATHVLSLNHIAVDPACRRHGVGRALYGAVEGEAREHGVERIVMDHWAFNVEAAAFFDSLGFERFNVRMRKAVAGS